MSRDLSKLTVPQLKALCKERTLVGYSKLGKPALLQKLAEVHVPVDNVVPLAQVEVSASEQRTNSNTGSSPTPASGVSEPTTGAGLPQEPIPSRTTSIQPRSNRLPARDSRNTFALTSAEATLTVRAVSTDLNAATQRTEEAECFTGPPEESILEPAGNCRNIPRALSRPMSPMLPPQQIPSRPSTKQGPKRKADSISMGRSTKKTKASSSSTCPQMTSQITSFKSPCAEPVLNANFPTRLAGRTPSPAQVQTTQFPPCSQTKSTRSNAGVPNTASTACKFVPGQRFKPLVIRKGPSPIKLRKTITSPSDPVVSSSCVFLSYLELPPALPMPLLQSIELPPSISQRKRVHQWAVILSALDDTSRRTCTLVSRLFRYAVYLSAAHLLKQDFAGKRLDLVLKTHSPAMTNLWPYLRLRQSEVTDRQRIYLQSFLPRALKGQPMPVSRKLWGSPNDERELTIALRFVMTRFWFALSVGSEGSEWWLHETVLDVREIVSGEIWSVKTCTICPGRTSTTSVDTFYVLEATCEVVGRLLDPSKPATRNFQAPFIPLRTDWAAYIKQHLETRSSLDDATNPITSRLKWANYEEYDRGISRLWLRRIESEGDVGTAKRAVAFRYVLACVVANSVSGTWRTSTEMAQDFAGLQSRLPAPVLKERGTSHSAVHLYLPEHHHVESVHFATSDQKPLLPALAIVQTSGREYFILRDNGMVVGCEEDGVAAVWMEVLRCTATGISLADKDSAAGR